MIRIYYEDYIVQYCIFIEFDADGAKELKPKLELALKKGEVSIELNNSSYLDIDKPIKTLIVCNSKEVKSSIVYYDEILKVNIYEECLDEFLIKINDYYTTGKIFWPVEICYVDYRGIEADLHGISL